MKKKTTIQFYSTNHKSCPVSFKEAVIKSLPEDNGLYFPDYIPNLAHISQLKSLSEIGFEVLRPYTYDSVPDMELEKIANEALNFKIPLRVIEKRISCLELFHGPTYAFKDVGVRFLARFLAYFNKNSNHKITILVATSGDTGSAVAAGFHLVEGVEVIILYPSGKVSELQEKQLTTLGGNVTALEVEGVFDECQYLVKEAFLDKEINKRKNLTSANSINIARWIPQSIYFHWVAIQTDQAPVVAVPSGNYGNIAAGMLAKKMGAQIKRFIAASNANNVVPQYLATGVYKPQPTIATYANAMDVGNPSNFSRILELYGNQYQEVVSEVSGGYLLDDETLTVIKNCQLSNKYTLDPHGAIGYQVLKQRIREEEQGVFLGTAHPCKFIPVLTKAIPDFKVPDFAQDLLTKKKNAIKISNSYTDFKEFLMSLAS